MAEKPSAPGPSAVAHIKGFFAILATIIFLWYFTGGYERSISQSGPLLRPPTSIGDTASGYGKWSGLTHFQFTPTQIKLTPDAGSGSAQSESSYNNPNPITASAPKEKVYGLQQTSVSLKNNITHSSYASAISIESYSGTSNTNPDQEYIVIKASPNNTSSITLTGWQLKSGVYGGSVQIGNGVYLPYQGTVNVEQPIALAPGERAYIVTGRSPTGVSFRENKCTGYFGQYQTFTPTLNTNCPMICDENIPVDPHGFNNYCLDILDRIPRCQIYTTPFTQQVTPECQRYIINNANYSGCVNLHKNDPDFVGGTWRIFLSREVKLWRDRREVIELLDPAGKIADAISY